MKYFCTLLLAASASSAFLPSLQNGLLSNEATKSFWPRLTNFLPIQDTFSQFNEHQKCPAKLPLTCTNSTPIESSCCFESPGGVMLQTQFWDYYPPVGGNESFTLHGLWPDNCDGTFEQFCNGKLNIRQGDIKRILLDEFHDEELYKKIQTSWKNFNGDDESLWVHEFNKHATCIRTIQPECYGKDFKRDQNVYDFLKITINLYEKYPTFDFLKENGIVPSLTETYTFEQINDALSSNFNGNKVFFKCNRHQALQEVWYFHHLRGPLTKEDFVQIPALTHSNCPKTGIKLIPKGSFIPPPSQPTGDPKGQRGFIKLSGHPGCLISNGEWYTQGTCAKFQIKDSQFGGRNLISSKGVCGINKAGVLSCNKQNQASQSSFLVDKSSGAISYGGKSEWCLHEAGKHGSGKFAQTPIKLAEDGCESFQIKISQ